MNICTTFFTKVACFDKQNLFGLENSHEPGKDGGAHGHVFLAGQKILSRTAFTSSFTRCQVNACDSFQKFEFVGYVNCV